MDKISIIIPVYNKEAYIEECIGSVQRQTHAAIEIIIIDDGSTDGSPGILKELAKQDTRINLILDKNHGVAHARNIGLQAATGAYIAFVDADDYIYTDYVARLYAEREYDLVVTGYKQLENGNLRAFSCGNRLARGYNEIENIYFDKSILPYMVMPVLKLFRRELLVCHNIEFINISFGEDADFVLQYLKHCQTVKMMDYQGYVNRIVPGTLSRKKVADMWGMSQRLMERCEDVFDDRNAGWQFFYIRLVKNCLLNSLDNWQEFKESCARIKEDRIENVKLLQSRSFNDFFTIICLKNEWIKLFYKLLLLQKR